MKTNTRREMEGIEDLLAIQEDQKNKIDQIFKLLLFPVSSDSNCATMAKKTLVHRSLTDANKLPNTTSSKRGSLS